MSEPSIDRALSVVFALALTACATTTPSGGGGPSEAPISAEASAAAGVVLVAMGDSIPVNLDADCPGCTGFVDSYAEALSGDVGEPVQVKNRARHDGARTIDIAEQVEADQQLLDELATADVILISVGFNDQPPFEDAHEGCPAPLGGAASAQEAIAAGAETSEACIDTVVPIIREQVAGIFEKLREVAPDAAIAVLTPYDSWRGWTEVEAAEPAMRDALYSAETYWFQQWNSALCDEADAAGATCVDVYHAFNGPEGTDPPAAFVAADYTHPSQEGNDVIRDLLIEANLLGS